MLDFVFTSVFFSALVWAYYRLQTGKLKNHPYQPLPQGSPYSNMLTVKTVVGTMAKTAAARILSHFSSRLKSI